jgi:hypothetical protein
MIEGRVAFMPADIDRRYFRDSLPDYADLLANVVRWAASGNIPLRVKATAYSIAIYTRNRVTSSRTW